MFKDVFKGLISPVTDIIKERVEDRDLANELTAAIKQTLLKAQTSVLLAEANGSKAQRNWRPHLMYMLMFIVGNSYIVSPYMNAMFGIDIPTTLDDNIWDLMKIGVGGYVVGRSAEKVVLNLKK